MKIQLKEFSDENEFYAKAYDLLKEYAEVSLEYPHAIVLPGGKTPLALYDLAAKKGIKPGMKLKFIISDERYVPEDSRHSNYRGMKKLFQKAGIKPKDIIRPNPKTSAGLACAKFKKELNDLFDDGGKIPLAFFGLGNDGHTASLFSKSHLQKAQDRMAIFVPRPDGMLGITTTPKLFSMIQRIIFLVKGKEKSEIVEKLVKSPSSTIAGLAVKDAGGVEVWFCK